MQIGGQLSLSLSLSLFSVLLSSRSFSSCSLCFQRHDRRSSDVSVSDLCRFKDDSSPSRSPVASPAATPPASLEIQLDSSSHRNFLTLSVRPGRLLEARDGFSSPGSRITRQSGAV